MWRAYTAGSIRRDRRTGVTAMVAVLIASAFLSLLCGAAYNTWADAVRRAGGAPLDGEPVAPLVAMVLAVGLSAVWIIASAFSVSMQARVRRMGILASVGATPRQIRTALVQEAFVLTLPAVAVGIAIGIGLQWGFIQWSSALSRQTGSDGIQFAYHGLILLITCGLCVLTVGVSALLCARKVARMTPLEAIRGGEELKVRKVRQFRVIGALFGVEGTLARRSLYARRRAFRTSTLSLTLSFLVFGTFMNFMTLSDISTQQTYFTKYQNTWDLMLSAEGTDALALLLEIRETPGVAGCIAHQKADAYAFVPEDRLSDALAALGGPTALRDTGIVAADGGYWVQAPLIILDDQSFAAYGAGLGAEAPGQSMVTINRIWDNVNSHFREPDYVPFVRETSGETLPLYAKAQADAPVATLPVGAYGARLPEIREDLVNFSLTQVMDYSTYEAIASNLPATATVYTIRNAPDADIAEVEAALRGLTAGRGYALENRLSEAEYNVSSRQALFQIIGILCGLIALIGLANVFANALGQVYQRRREFARYLSVGLTPGGVRKMLLVEALVVGTRPILVALPLIAGMAALFIQAGRMRWADFLPRMPVGPVVLFAVLLLAAVALAYALGYRAIMRQGDMVASLRDDTTM